jgi:Delta6-protoilludene synthase
MHYRYASSMIIRDRLSLRCAEVASVSSYRRFIAAMDKWVDSLIDEAADREKGHIRGIADYLELRRNTVGVYPSFLFLEVGLDIPDEVMEHSAIRLLLNLLIEVTVLANVSYST